MTGPEQLQQVDRTYVLSNGRRLSYFAGCDYFRLGSHPKVLAAFRLALDRFGGNVAASRMTTGNHAVYEELELELADHFRAQAAVLVPTGYCSNLIVAQALRGEFTHAFIDEAAHASLLDAARLLEARVTPFAHRDPKALATRLGAVGKSARSLVMTDGLFARDGAVAPLRAYREVLPPGTMFLVDDAHGAGVLGAHGRGTPESERLSREHLVQTITLSKSLGCYGGAVLCAKDLRGRILSRSRVYIGSTPTPLPLAQAALAALKLLRNGTTLRKRLARNTAYVRGQLASAGLDVPNEPGPIISLVPANAREKAAIRAELLARGVYPSFIKYPGAPAQGCFRFVISSEHSRRQLEDLAQALCRVVTSRRTIRLSSSRTPAPRPGLKL